MPMTPEDKKKLWLSAFLFTMAIGLYWKKRPKRPQVVPPPAAAATTPPANVGASTTAPSPAQPSPVTDLNAVRAYLQPLSDTLLYLARRREVATPSRDPFGNRPQPPSNAPLAAPDPVVVTPPPIAPRVELVLSGIVISGGKRRAIVNDLSFDVGDRLPGGATLASIQEDRIVVAEPNGGRRVITIRP